MSDNADRIAYGIAAYAASDSDSSAIVLASVSDICGDKSRAEALAEKCNRLGVSPLHLPDIIEDFLAV